MYQPSELRDFLHQLGIAPKKGLSQNFLIDGNIVRKIVAAANVEKGDFILEIGPGPGALTQELLAQGAHVVAVEKDKVLANALLRLQTEDLPLHVFCEDFLLFSLEQELQKINHSGRQFKVIANLPYHLTTPILAKLIPHASLISSLTVMVQQEVARRMTALPSTCDYGSLTLFLRFYSQTSYQFHVSRNCFYPIPKVDSAIVSLYLRSAPLSDEETKNFFVLTRLAFEQRRKMMRVSLKPLLPPPLITQGLKAIGKNPLARPENLSLEDFLRLYEFFKKSDSNQDRK